MQSEKINVINVLRTIASPEEQAKYNANVPIANVPDELIAQWFDDFFHPDIKDFVEMFSDEEWRVLEEFHKFFLKRLPKIPRSFEDMQCNNHWIEVIRKANWTINELGWNDL